MHNVNVPPEILDIDPDFAAYLDYCERHEQSVLDDVDEEDIW